MDGSFWLKKWHTFGVGFFAILAVFWEWLKPYGPRLAKLRHLRFRRRDSFSGRRDSFSGRRDSFSGRRRPDPIPMDGDGPASRVPLEDGNEDRMEFLPEEYWRNVVKLSCESTAEGGICDVYLVGTAHVSQESCEQVKAVIRISKPQVVFLELCPIRMPVLLSQNLKVPTMRDMVEMWKTQHDIFGILYSWFLAKVASKLEVCPGSEFRVAWEEAFKYDENVLVKLGDRPVEITLQRTWAMMPLWHKTKLLYSVVIQAFFLPSSEDLNKMLKEMDDVDMLTRVIQDMSKQFPTLMETLVHERDQYMSATLEEVAGKYSSVVAVVGKGHLQGIKKNWKRPVEVTPLSDILFFHLLYKISILAPQRMF